MTAMDLQESAALQMEYDAAAADVAPGHGGGGTGPSYATLARLGLAAPTGPVVGSADSAASPGVPPLGTSPGARGAWGPRAGVPAAATPPAAPKGAWGAGRPAQAPAAAADSGGEGTLADGQGARRNKKGQKVGALGAHPRS